MDEPVVFHCCAVCDRPFESGSGDLGGLYIASYQINVCISCFNENRRGWAHELEDRVSWTLQDQGLNPPPRNRMRLLPRGL